jgi:phosphate-selective porin OprO/OprP
VTQYLKVYLDWQHGDFGSPVQFAPGRRQSTSDMFLLRAQLYFLSVRTASFGMR